MTYHQKFFQEKVLKIKEKKIKYYLSPTLIKNNFQHGFFSKTSSKINLILLSKYLNLNDRNCVLNQIHSNQVVFGSNLKNSGSVEADGIVSDRKNQNLWIYTADCMPILFADKRKRLVAAIHCGRKGLENKIIKNLIKVFDNLGTSKEDLIVAIGPSISKKNYLIDEQTFIEFHKKLDYEESNTFPVDNEISLNSNNLGKFTKKGLISLDIKKNAYFQLLNENIPNENIDISNLCTYELNNNFNSWRRSKTTLRQWNFISS